MPTLEYLSWSSFRLVSDEGVRIVIDPFIKGSPASGIPPATESRESISDADLMLVTHAAKDHLGQAFELLHMGEAILGASLDVRLLAASDGIAQERMVSMVPNSPFVMKDVTVIPTLSKHISSAIHENGQWIFGMPLSFFIQFAGGQCVFHAGDTAISLDLGLYGDLYRPTVGLFGIGGQIHPGRQAVVEMSPKEAAISARMMGAAVAIPCHFAPDDELELSFQNAVAEHAPGVRATILRVGDSIELSDRR
jgi:L-ascorbate metabolism protein UlaG (beta-lactamase superfamily)